jgi:hypothetical protein
VAHAADITGILSTTVILVLAYTRTNAMTAHIKKHASEIEHVVAVATDRASESGQDGSRRHALDRSSRNR